MFADMTGDFGDVVMSAVCFTCTINVLSKISFWQWIRYLLCACLYVQTVDSII